MAGRHPGRVAVGLDYRVDADGVAEVAVRGWAASGGRRLDEVVAGLAAAEARPAAVVVTAIERDGTLAGPDLAGLGAVLAATDLP